MLQSLLEDYRSAIAEAQRVAPFEEPALYAMHIGELERLSVMLLAKSSASEVASLLKNERRSFGWSYLPGAHGERVESAFHALASFLEQPSAERSGV